MMSPELVEFEDDPDMTLWLASIYLAMVGVNMTRVKRPNHWFNKKSAQEVFNLEKS